MRDHQLRRSSTADARAVGATARPWSTRLLELFREGELNPSVAAVAERSGVSLRSVFRYFDDLDEMGRIAIARATSTSRSTCFDLPKIGEGTRAERIDALAAQRSRLYERVAPVVRAAMLRAPFQPVIAEGLVARRALLREQLRAAVRARARDAPRRRAVSLVVSAADALASFETMELLRLDQKLSTASAVAVVALARPLAAS